MFQSGLGSFRAPTCLSRPRETGIQSKMWPVTLTLKAPSCLSRPRDTKIQSHNVALESNLNCAC